MILTDLAHGSVIIISNLPSKFQFSSNVLLNYILEKMDLHWVGDGGGGGGGMIDWEPPWGLGLFPPVI